MTKMSIVNATLIRQAMVRWEASYGPHDVPDSDSLVAGVRLKFLTEIRASRVNSRDVRFVLSASVTPDSLTEFSVIPASKLLPSFVAANLRKNRNMLGVSCCLSASVMS